MTRNLRVLWRVTRRWLGFELLFHPSHDPFFPILSSSAILLRAFTYFPIHITPTGFVFLLCLLFYNHVIPPGFMTRTLTLYASTHLQLLPFAFCLFTSSFELPACPRVGLCAGRQAASSFYAFTNIEPHTRSALSLKFTFPGSPSGLPASLSGFQPARWPGHYGLC